ncbi:hypothetical protein SCHPADRAFT_948253, partial [Schizopora paradoxa]
MLPAPTSDSLADDEGSRSPSPHRPARRSSARIRSGHLPTVERHRRVLRDRASLLYPGSHRYSSNHHVKSATKNNRGHTVDPTQGHPRTSPPAATWHANEEASDMEDDAESSDAPVPGSAGMAIDSDGGSASGSEEASDGVGYKTHTYAKMEDSDAEDEDN